MTPVVLRFSELHWICRDLGNASGSFDKADITELIDRGATLSTKLMVRAGEPVEEVALSLIRFGAQRDGVNDVGAIESRPRQNPGCGTGDEISRCLRKYSGSSSRLQHGESLRFFSGERYRKVGVSVKVAGANKGVRVWCGVEADNGGEVRTRAESR